MLRLKTHIIIASILLLTGCGKATYAPPIQSHNANDYSIEINKPFDDVWKSLIQYSASTFFAIDNYEKDSGLITLSFGSGNAADFITGGNWVVTSPNLNFNGDYVNYMEKYRNGSLQGKMNIVVTSLNDNTTKVIVNARYIFSVPPQQHLSGETWSFDTGSCGSIYVSQAARGTTPERTICPTYKAERAILSALQE